MLFTHFLRRQDDIVNELLLHSPLFPRIYFPVWDRHISGRIRAHKFVAQIQMETNTDQVLQCVCVKNNLSVMRVIKVEIKVREWKRGVHP